MRDSLLTYDNDRLVMTWEAFDAYVEKLVKMLRAHADAEGMAFTGDYGFPRGGLCLAVKLSHLMGLPLLLAPAPNCVVCDDISDSGETLLKYQRSAQYVTVTLLARQGTAAMPAYYGELVETGHWVLFPWEA